MVKRFVPFRAQATAAVLLLQSLSPVFLYAQGNGGQPGQFMAFGAGGRALGMGGAFFAVSDDASASYWNPAGLAQLQRKELMAMQATLFEDTALSFLSYAHPTAAAGTWAFNLTQLSSGGFEKVEVEFDSTGTDIISIKKTGSFEDSQRALGVAWGKQIGETLALGMLLKRIQRTLADSSDSFFSFDLSGLKNFGAHYRLGVGLQNVVSLRSGDTDDKLPIIFKLGNAYTAMGDRLTIGFDIDKGQNSDMGWHLGGEYWVLNWWALRFGIQGSPGLRETDFGFGLRYRSFGLDLAQGIHELGSSTRFSASFHFGDSVRARTEKQVKQLVEEAFEAFRAGNFVLSLQRFNRALDVDPANPQVKQMIARLESIIAFVAQATGEEEFAQFVRRGVIAYVEGKDLDAAVNALRYAYNKNPQDDKVLRLLNLVEKEARVEEVTRKPVGPGVFTFVDQKIYDARQAVYETKYDLAIRRAQDVLDLEPRNVTALEIMGSAFFLMDQKDKAKVIWQKVLEVDPTNKVVPQFLKQLQ